jgi:hypothetical protein
VICQGGARVGNLHGAAIRDRFEEPQEAYLMRANSRVCRRRSSDLRDMYWPSGQS